MYAAFFPSFRHVQHSTMYPAPSEVHLGAAMHSSLPGFDGIGQSLLSSASLSSASCFNRALPWQTRHPCLPQHQSPAHGLFLPRRSTIVAPPHLSTNLAKGLPVASPIILSTSCNLLFKADSLVKGMNTGVSMFITFPSSSLPSLVGPSPC